MRAVLTRVKHASVSVDGKIIGQIGEGFLVLLVTPSRTRKPPPRSLYSSAAAREKRGGGVGGGPAT